MRRKVLNWSSRGWFLENTQPPRNSGCLSHSASLSGEKERAGAALRGANTAVWGSFQRRSGRGKMAAQLCCAPELICTAAFYVITWRPPASTGYFNESSRASADCCAQCITRFFFITKCKVLKVYFVLYRRVSSCQLSILWFEHCCFKRANI